MKIIGVFSLTLSQTSTYFFLMKVTQNLTEIIILNFDRELEGIIIIVQQFNLKTFTEYQLHCIKNIKI